MAERECKSYRVLVGLEVHVQLATQTKMFTGAPNGATNFGAEPNSLVNEVILGLPGTLPVMNKKAVEYSIMVGLALGCKIARHSKWDRKSYYYPDLPKNYQISQYDLPLCGEGTFEIAGEDGSAKTVRIRRAHLEEDAGKLLHEAPGGYKIDHSIVDLNRAGTPLLEIVTEPDLTSPKDVATFGQELQKLVQFLGVSEAQMQRGHMRFEPNINVHITDQNDMVHKTAISEIKNLNSFSVLERATAYEIQRQLREWEETGSLGRKCTMGWEESTQSTFLQREKEDAQDYRYFPDPDLVPVEVDDAWLSELKGRVNNTPAQHRLRLAVQYKLSPDEIAQLTQDRATVEYFYEAVTIHPDAKLVTNLMLNPLAQVAKKREMHLAETSIEPARLAQAASLVEGGTLPAGRAAAFFELIEEKQHLTDDDLADILVSSDASAIDAAIDALLAQKPKSVDDYKAGKQAALGALVGMVMRNAKGLNPKLVQERLKERLK